MREIVLKAPAKINLGLSILRKLPTNYHEVKTIYSQISLFDVLKIKETPKDKIEIDCGDKRLPTGRENLVFKAAQLIKKITRPNRGVKIFIKKKIPIGSGLGGASSDAAQVLIGLNKLWRLGLSLKELTTLAKKIGMDVGYQLYGGVRVEVQGGERMGQFIRLKDLPQETSIVICFPEIVIKSSRAYQSIKYDKIGGENLAGLEKAINNQNLFQIGQNLHNDFELWTFKKYPLIKKIKEKMLTFGALGSLMSGKGSAVFGLFDNFEIASRCRRSLKKEFKQTFLVKPI